jgi:hypothetical protein
LHPEQIALHHHRLSSGGNCRTVGPRYNAGRGRKNFEAKNRVIARSAL